MVFDTCRRPNPMPMVLPNNETIQEECTSRERFSSHVIAAGLECWLKPNLQVPLSLSLCIILFKTSCQHILATPKISLCNNHTFKKIVRYSKRFGYSYF